MTLYSATHFNRVLTEHSIFIVHCGIQTCKDDRRMCSEPLSGICLYLQHVSCYKIWCFTLECGLRRGDVHLRTLLDEVSENVYCTGSGVPRNSEDIGGVFDRMSKKSRRLDFRLQFTVFSYGCNLLNKVFLIQTVLQWRIWFRSSNPPRHPESLTKSNRNANWAENIQCSIPAS